VALSRERKIEDELTSGFDELTVFDEASTRAEIDKMHVSRTLSVAAKSSFEHESRIASASDRPLLVHKSPQCESGRELLCIEDDRVCQMDMLQFLLCRY
jgi:hypothetical protein